MSENEQNEEPPPLEEKMKEGLEIYQEAVEKEEPSHKFALFSGGDDSLVSTHFLMEQAGADAVVHLDTGIGIPETYEYIEDVCDQYGWELIVYKAKEHVDGDGNPDPQIYEEMVKERGFPGPAMHWKMYQRLKLRSIERILRDYKTHWFDRILLGTGRYKRESQRRMELEDVAIDREGAKLWVNPLFYWWPQNITEYRRKFDLPRNPVAKKLCMSGECLCAAFSEGEKGKEERARLAAFYPMTHERICELEEEVWEEGHKWKWHERPEAAEERGEETDYEPPEPPEDMDLRLCANCLPDDSLEDMEDIEENFEVETGDDVFLTEVDEQPGEWEKKVKKWQEAVYNEE